MPDRNSIEVDGSETEKSTRQYQESDRTSVDSTHGTLSPKIKGGVTRSVSPSLLNDASCEPLQSQSFTTSGTPKNKIQGQAKNRRSRKADDIFSIDGYDMPSAAKKVKVEKKGKGKQRVTPLYTEYDNDDAHLTGDDAGPIGQPSHLLTSPVRGQDRGEPSVKERKSSVRRKYLEMPPAKRIKTHPQPKPVIKSEIKSLPEKGRQVLHTPDAESPGSSPLLIYASNKELEVMVASDAIQSEETIVAEGSHVPTEPAEDRVPLSYPPFPSRSAPRPSVQSTGIRKGGSISDILHKTGLHARSGSNSLRRTPGALSLPMFSNPPAGLPPPSINPDNKANDFNFDGEDG